MFALFIDFTKIRVAYITLLEHMDLIQAVQIVDSHTCAPD